MSLGNENLVFILFNFLDFNFYNGYLPHKIFIV